MRFNRKNNVENNISVTQLREAMDKIRPSEELISKTLDRVHEKQNEKSFSPRRFENIFANQALWRRAAPVMCALAIALVIGFQTLNKLMPYEANGSFTEIDAYGIVTADTASYISARTVGGLLPYDEKAYLEHFSNWATEENMNFMVADGRVTSCNVYKAQDENATVKLVCVLQIELYDVISQSKDIFHTFDKRDKITAILYPISETACEGMYMNDIRFCLTTGLDGTPTDEASKAIGAYDSWVVYDCYAPKTN